MHAAVLVPRAAAEAPAPVPAAAAVVPKKELVQAKRREDELTVRLAAMEAELATLRGSHGNAQGQIAEVNERLVVRILLSTSQLQSDELGFSLTVRPPNAP